MRGASALVYRGRRTTRKCYNLYSTFEILTTRDGPPVIDAKTGYWLKISIFSQPSIYIDGWLYGMRMTSVVCNVPVLSQNDSTYHHSVFTT